MPLLLETNDIGILIKYGVLRIKTIFKQRYNYMRTGVWYTNLVPENAVQCNLFFKPDPKNAQFNTVVDRLNRRYGKLTVRPASCGYNRDKWKIRQLQVSPHYTTRISDILQI